MGSVGGSPAARSVAPRTSPSATLDPWTWLARSAFAQEASIFGTVTDSTSGALPGVTVTGTSLSTGRVYTTVSDERGEYRLRALQPGRYKVQAELSGFATVVVSDATWATDKTDLRGKRWPAEDVHALSLANLHGEYATVLDTASVLQAMS